MFLVFSVCILYTLYCILAYFEEYIPNSQRKIIYWCTGAILVILAGLREVGIDPDSENYEQSFLNPYSNNIQDAVELSYILIAQTLNSITNDVHTLFLVYALLGVLLKFVAFSKYSDSWFLIVLMYICFYFELHETCQIRAGVLSGCMLMAVPCIADGQRIKAFLWILFGSFFHMSGVVLLPLLFLSNKPLGLAWKTVLALSIPLSYMFAGFNLGLEFASELPYIGNKIAFYTEIEEKGKMTVSSLNLFSPLHLLFVFIFYYLLFFADTLTDKSRYFPLMMKIMATALLSYAVFSFIPVMGERIGSLYRVVSIVLFPSAVYTLLPKWCGMLLVFLITFVLINFSLRNMYNVTIFLSAAN